MKNLPEKELFNNLESRLRQYTEEPDEKSWDKISAALHPAKPGGKGIWLERTADVLVITLLLFLFWNSIGTDVNFPQRSSTEKLTERKAVPEEDDSISSSTLSRVTEQQTASSYRIKSGDAVIRLGKEEIHS